MLKKMVFVAIVLALVGTSFGGVRKPGGLADTVSWRDQDGYAEIKGEAWAWPAEYKFQPIAVLPVKMDIGFWIRVKNAKDDSKVLKLKQIEVHKYQGTLTLDLVANTAFDLSVAWSKASGMPTINKDYLDVNPTWVDAGDSSVTISLGVKDVDLAGFQSGPTNCLEIGTVTLSVRPRVTPNLVGGCS